jgi:hypothetical protein
MNAIVELKRKTHLPQHVFHYECGKRKRTYLESSPVVPHTLTEIALCFFLNCTLIVLQCGRRLFEEVSVVVLTFDAELQLKFLIGEIVVGSWFEFFGVLVFPTGGGRSCYAGGGFGGIALVFLFLGLYMGFWGGFAGFLVSGGHFLSPLSSESLELSFGPWC